MRGYLRTKINRKRFFYLLILGIVFSVFIFLAFLNVQFKKQNFISDIFLSPLVYTPQKYPEILNESEPIISAEGAIVLDRDSQVPIYQKNPKLRFSPASTTKIMTALIALDYFKPQDILTIYKMNVEGTNIGFKVNESFTFQDLLYAMLLPSANDATLAIAENYPGGEQAFVAKMNEKARSFHLTDTSYQDPIGLMDQKDYTTAVDLARLSSIALQNPTFAQVVATKSWQIKSQQGNNYVLYNLNKLLDLPGVNGVKTGFTEGAGQVLVTSKKTPENRDLIIVVMQSQDRFGDTEILLNYLYNNINYLSIQP